MNTIALYACVDLVIVRMLPAQRRRYGDNEIYIDRLSAMQNEGKIWKQCNNIANISNIYKDMIIIFILACRIKIAVSKYQNFKCLVRKSSS